MVVVVSSSAINALLRFGWKKVFRNVEKREYRTKVGCRSDRERRERRNRQPANVVLEVGRERRRKGREEKVVVIKEVAKAVLGTRNTMESEKPLEVGR